MSSSGRALNALEISMHRLIIGCRNQTATQHDIDTITAAKEDKQTAINYLLAAGMLKLLKDDKSGRIFYKGVNVKEAKNKASLDKDAQTVLEYIEESKNEGIWTKALERRSDLPQKVVQKSLKVLEQQGLIKPIKSVKYPTRKMYMMFHLAPSVEVTGGVWYTDQEFDSAFVRVLLDHIYNYIAKQSLPPHTTKCSRPLYPRSESSRFPNLTRITEWIKKSGISEVKLTKDDIELLLRVLEFDGRVEKIPSNGLIQMSDDEEDASGKRRKNVAGKRKRKGDVSEEDDSDAERKKRRRKDMEESEEEERSKKKKPGKGRMELSDDETDRKFKPKKSLNDGSDNEEDEKRKKVFKRNNTESEHSDSSADNPYRFAELEATEAFVYRAIRPVQGVTEVTNGGTIFSFSGAGSAWLGGGEQQLPWAEAPCVRCPQFDFCEEGGPVNAASCEYLKQWLDPERVTTVQEPLKGEEETEAAVLVEMEA